MSTNSEDATPEREALCESYKRIFALRNQKDGMDGLIELFRSTSSALLRHEVAYALGQMQDTCAVPFLGRLLLDADEDPIVRHEAAEALGAIGTAECWELLDARATDAAVEVRETCALALARHQFEIAKGPCSCELQAGRLAAMEKRALGDENAPEPQSSYLSVDPAPPAEEKDVDLLAAQLCDRSAPLFERYRAMFALRNAASGRGAERAVLALCGALEAGAASTGAEGSAVDKGGSPGEEDPATKVASGSAREGDSALLKHELAFVLGQLEHPASVPTLTAAVRCEAEHPMVRHEAAEALGAVGSLEAVDVLREFSRHPEPILRESCVVALHMYDREAFLAAGVCV